MKLFIKAGYSLEETIRCTLENGARFFGMGKVHYQENSTIWKASMSTANQASHIIKLYKDIVKGVFCTACKR